MDTYDQATRAILDAVHGVGEGVSKVSERVTAIETKLTDHIDRSDIHCVPPCSELVHWRWAIVGALGIATLAAMGALWRIVDRLIVGSGNG